MKKFNFLNQAGLCFCLMLWFVSSSCSAINLGRDEDKGSRLWSLVIGVENNDDDELLVRLANMDALRLVDTDVTVSEISPGEMVLLSPSYERLSVIRTELFASGTYRVKLNRVEK